jgi:hypothetical protein
MPAGSGIVYSATITPDAAGVLIVTARFDVQGSYGSDWGSSWTSRLFCTQNAATVNGSEYPFSTTRGCNILRSMFNITAGADCEIGVYGTISGAVAATWWNVHLTAELIKR